MRVSTNSVHAADAEVLTYGMSPDHVATGIPARIFICFNVELVETPRGYGEPEEAGLSVSINMDAFQVPILSNHTLLSFPGH